jgi:hypothetical protein
MLLAALLLQGRVSVLTTRWPACWWLLRRFWGLPRKALWGALQQRKRTARRCVEGALPPA